MLLLLLLLLACPTVSYAQSTGCHCVASNSTYLTSAKPPTTTATLVSSSVSSIGLESSSSSSSSSISSSTHVTSPAPTAAPGFILLNHTNSLTVALDPSHAFNRSKPSFEFDQATNVFKLPRVSGNAELVIDLLVGPTGTPCRPMPYLEKVCVYGLCSGCNVNIVTASATNDVHGANGLNQRIIFPIPITPANEPLCASRAEISPHGDFRYLVFLPAETPPNPSQPYAFRVSVTGTFASYRCPAARRKRSVQQPLDSSSNSVIGSADDEAPADSFLWQLSRHRRQVPSDCSCPVGLDPVFTRSRTAHVSWEFPLKTFSVALSNISSVEHMALAIESYYLFMDAVRNLSVSNLTAVIGDLFDIEFSPVAAMTSRAQSQAAVASSDSTGTRLRAKVSIRNDSFYSDEFLLEQLKVILPGYGSSIVNLTVQSETSTITTLAPVASLPAFGIVLICIAGAAALVASIPLAMWLHRVIRAKSRSTDYIVRGPPPESSTVNGPPDGNNGVANNGRDEEQRLGRTIDASVEMPVTFFGRGDGSDWRAPKPFDDSTTATPSSPQVQPDDNKPQVQLESAIYSTIEVQDEQNQ